MIEIRQVETSVNLLKYYMKKVHFILWFIQAVLFSTVVEAAPIDHKEAIRIADKFMFSNRENILDKCERAISELNQLCVVNYVFQNRAVGFVIVGLDDSLPSPILAFSPFGRVNLQNGTMKKLLDSYSHEIIEWQGRGLLREILLFIISERTLFASLCCKVFRGGRGVPIMTECRWMAMGRNIWQGVPLSP